MDGEFRPEGTFYAGYVTVPSVRSAGHRFQWIAKCDRPRSEGESPNVRTDPTTARFFVFDQRSERLWRCEFLLRNMGVGNPKGVGLWFPRSGTRSLWELIDKGLFIFKNVHMDFEVYRTHFLNTRASSSSTI